MKFAPRNRVMYLETIANKESGNPDAQAEYLKVWHFCDKFKKLLRGNLQFSFN